MEIFDYVILGAGLGGLSAAACLTRQGYRVAVLEQHYLPGGCCHTFDYGDYRFCADVHYIYQCGPNQTVSQFLDYIGREVTFNSLDPDCIDRVITPMWISPSPSTGRSFGNGFWQSSRKKAVPSTPTATKLSASTMKFVSSGRRCAGTTRSGPTG